MDYSEYFHFVSYLEHYGFILWNLIFSKLKEGNNNDRCNVDFKACIPDFKSQDLSEQIMYKMV